MTGEAQRVVVIGAGIGGMSAATFLRSNGYDVEVYEAADRPGGVAVTRWLPGATVEGGLYFLLECFPGQAAFEVYRALGIVPWEGIEPMETYLELLDQPTGSRLVVTRDLDKLQRDLEAIAPEDGEQIATLVSGARSFRRFDAAKASFENPPELTTWIDRLALGWHARHVLGVFAKTKLVKQTVADWISTAKSPALRELVQGFFPFSTVPPFFAMMILGQLAEGQLGRVVGSPEELVARMEARCKALGVRIHYGTPVAKISIEAGRAAGVELESGDSQRAHAVVSTVDTGQLLGRFLDGGALVAGSVVETQWKHWPRVPTGAFVSFVTEGDWEARPWYLQARLVAPIVTGAVEAERLTVRFCKPGIAGANAGECVVETGCDAELAWFVEGDEVTLRARRDQFVSDVLSRMETIVPGFSARVLRHELVTPDVFARAVRAPDGNVGAYQPTLAAMEVECPRTFPAVKGLYLAGQWAIAGAGVLAVAYSGRHVAQLLCRDDGRTFRLFPE